LAIKPLNAELNPICRLLALLGAHLIFHVSGVRVKNNSLVTLYGQEVRTSEKSISSKRHKDVILPFTTCYQHFTSFYLGIGEISLF